MPNGPKSPSPKPVVLVSACLLGQNCRYDGGHCNRPELLDELEKQGSDPLAFCPEEAGGLPTPRDPASIHAPSAADVLEGTGQVISDANDDCTGAFREGADQALQTCVTHRIQRAYLKEGSPSCGVRQTHVRGRRVDGAGVTATRLIQVGIEVVGID